MSVCLAVGLSAWIIQDGNYDDFRQGDNAPFALEFYAPRMLEKIEPNETARPALTHIGNALYTVRGRVAHVFERWWSLDVGLEIYREEKAPESLRVGDWLGGDIWLGIDPFFYFESLAREPDTPALIHDWRIRSIDIQDGAMG